MPSFAVFLMIVSLSPNVKAQTRYTFKGNAACGDTLKGIRTTNEFTYYYFTASTAYKSVYIETCLSDHDTVLYLFNSDGEYLKSTDDVDDHPNPTRCNNRYSGDLTVDGAVAQGASYYFGIYGYNAQSVGSYTMTLHCIPNDDNNIPSPPSECGRRHRKPWDQLTVAERDLYISGFHRLSQDGKMKIFTATHVEDASEAQAHGTSSFLPWHRWFIWELESQIRELGGKWRCFSMPYWDWTYEVSVHGSNVHNFHILNSGLGGSGNPNSNYCIMRGTFRRGNYETYWCDHDRDSCCLRRNPQRLYAYPGAADMMRRILSYRHYGGDTAPTGDVSSSIDGYRESLEGRPHAVAHTVTAGGNQYHLGSMHSPDDPIFYLLHSFVDYQWTLWQDCHDFDQISATDITRRIYEGGLRSITEGGPSRIDDIMLYPYLKDIEWSLLNRNSWSITPRRMHSIQSEYLSYSYEKGTFWRSANVDRFCRNINSDWFYNEQETSGRRLMDDREEIISNDIDEFARVSFELIFGSLQINDGVNNELELFDSWADIQCEYEEREIPNDCKVRPRYFEDCIAMKDKFKGKKDIEITLDEMLNKKGLTKCMKKTRRLFYHWAKRTFQLYRLCNGDFDEFCDHTIDKNEADQITCYINDKEMEVQHGNMQSTFGFAVYLVIGIQTIAIMYLICKRNDKNIQYVHYNNV